jgi:hypothetical protein
MKHDTANEACKHVRWIRFGGRRRRCASCGVTRRIRRKKRGPKAAKRRASNLRKTFVDGFTITQQSKRSLLNERAFAKRHARLLAGLCERPWPVMAPHGPLILVIDAIWFWMGEKRNTIYLLGLRAVEEDELRFLRPILRPGHESQKRWREIIAGIPPKIRKRILAVVSDSFSGAEGIAKERGWVFQRCQAHLLLRLETLCGDKKRAVTFWEGRQELKRVAYALMNAREEAKAETFISAFAELGAHRDCPRGLRMIVTETLRNLHEYRACYRHPELRLPATTNALENTNGRIRSLLSRSRGCRTPESLIRWITGYLYFHSVVKCRPKIPTEIRR